MARCETLPGELLDARAPLTLYLERNSKENATRLILARARHLLRQIVAALDLVQFRQG